MNKNDKNIEEMDADGLTRSQKISYWKTAVGLQDVDGLQISDYMRSLIKDNINGKITQKEVYEKINAYYGKSVDTPPWYKDKK